MRSFVADNGICCFIAWRWYEHYYGKHGTVTVGRLFNRPWQLRIAYVFERGKLKRKGNSERKEDNVSLFDVSED
jgi:hypothetical protein